MMEEKERIHHLYFASCEKDGGIYHYTLRDGEQEFTDKTACDRPMYLNIVGDKLQAVLRSSFADNEESGLITYEISADGSLKQTGKIISTKGVVGCHLCEFAGNTYVANYISGSVFGTNDCLDIHTGKGVHPIRQEAPHMHFVGPSPDGKYLLAVDLGLDAVFVYDKDLNVVDKAYVPEGHGARHLAYSEDGNYVFCVNELAGSVTVFAYQDGSLTPLETVSALEYPVEGNTAAAIRIKGDYVYVSHRGDDSIACLSWHDEKLQLCAVTKCGGEGPRDFIIIDDLLLCTNEKSHTISVLSVNGANIVDTGKRIGIKSPICVVIF